MSNLAISNCLFQRGQKISDCVPSELISMCRVLLQNFVLASRVAYVGQLAWETHEKTVEVVGMRQSQAQTAEAQVQQTSILVF